MTKEERKAIKILADLGQSFQTADGTPGCIVTYTLKSGYTYSGRAISEIIMRILNLIKKQQELSKILLKDIYNSIQNDNQAAIISICANDSDTLKEIVSKYNELAEKLQNRRKNGSNY